MRRIEPPQLATWMVEHLTPAGERDEALAGDLEEHFRAGRSEAWYWRQALAAVAMGWAQHLNRRRSMLVFALLWSMLSPAWTLVIERAENSSRVFGQLWEMDWPFSTLANFGVWLMFNVAFVWAGILLFVALHARFSRRLERKRVTQALLLVPAVFLPLYVISFIVSNLLAYPGPSVDLRALSLMGAVTDVRRWAVVMRVLYTLTMVASMWRMAPRVRGEGTLGLAEWAGSNPRLTASVDSFAVKRFFGFVVTAGLMNALIAAFCLCRLPESHTPGLGALLTRAAMYVAVGAVAGTAGAWIYWNNPASPFRDGAPTPFRLFAVTCAAGWVWMPAMVIFYEQITPVTAGVAAIGAFVLASGLRRVPVELPPAPVRWPAEWPEKDELFADSLLRKHWDGNGLLIAVAIYLAGYAIVGRSFMAASLLLGLAAFLFGWKRTVRPEWTGQTNRSLRRAVVRLALIVLPAVLVTGWALLDGVAHRNRVMADSAAHAAEGVSGAEQKAAKQNTARGLGGYESVILWPYPAKKEIAAPLPAQTGVLAPGTTRPLTLRFDGPYWYLQPPDTKPGPGAHQAHGTPLGVRIEATNSLPLVMEARQRLGEEIPLARCREIQVDVENRDEHPGTIGVALLVEDSVAPGKTELYVGRQEIVTGKQGASGLQTFRFDVPERAPGQLELRRFDEVTVMLLPETVHAQIGPRVAVREFRLYPR